MRIGAVGSALPQYYYDQPTLTRYLMELWRGDDAVLRRLRKLHDNVRVRGRHLALPLEEYAKLRDFTDANAAWQRVALELGEVAVEVALRRAGLVARDVDALFFATVTGLASPSVDARLVNRMGMRPDVVRVPIFGLGCVAGAAVVARAADFVRERPDAVALVVTIELCSLTLQRDDRSTANLISTGLFGDGAGAAIVVGSNRPHDGPVIEATRSVFYPDTEEVMGWHIGAHGFRIMLSESVATMAREQLPGDLSAFLGDHGLTRDQIGSWVCHPGGPKVLQALQEGLELHGHELALSWDNLERHGNLSSASVLLILEDTIRRARPAAGSHGVMLAMGPGFCSELLLLRW